jgi:precorrin-6A/cobalt-precorrin-6A reductase
VSGGPAPARVLLLAGTAEATAVASLLAARPDVELTASLAGHTTAPARLPCVVRTGGFGGVDGLAGALRAGGYRALVDGTHPFAAVMPHNAAAAARLADVPRVRLLRPPWQPEAGDAWREVDDLAEAAATLGELGARRVLLTVGRLDLAAFAPVAGVTSFVVRSIEPPEPLPLDPVSTTVVLARGPFGIDDEVALLRRHEVDTLVTKNSGAVATAAKLAAARAQGVTVVMVRRPPPPPGPLVTTPEAAVRWLDGHVLVS